MTEHDQHTNPCVPAQGLARLDSFAVYTAAEAQAPGSARTLQALLDMHRDLSWELRGLILRQDAEPKSPESIDEQRKALEPDVVSWKNCAAAHLDAVPASSRALHRRELWRAGQPGQPTFYGVRTGVMVQMIAPMILGTVLLCALLPVLLRELGLPATPDTLNRVAPIVPYLTLILILLTYSTLKRYDRKRITQPDRAGAQST